MLSKILGMNRFQFGSGSTQDVVVSSGSIPEGGKSLRLGERGSPLGRALYAVGEEAMGESVAWHLLFLIFNRAVDRVSDKVASAATGLSLCPVDRDLVYLQP